MKKAGDLLNSFFNEVQVKEGKAYNDFHSKWKDIAGEKISNNSTIKDVDSGYLIVEIDHPGWKQLISLKEKQIIWKINKQFPELSVKKIKFSFKNRPESKLTDVIESPKGDNVEKVDNKDFYELLKKMNKRSEE